MIALSIVICGKICSGKSTLAKLLASKHSIYMASFGAYLRSYCLKNNIEPTRTNLQDLGETFIKQDPHSFLENVLKENNDSSNDIVIFEGVRHTEILSGINNLSRQCKIVYLDVEDNIRYERHIRRSPSQPISLEEFVKNDGHVVESQIEELKRISDYIIKVTDESNLNKLEDIIKQVKSTLT